MLRAAVVVLFLITSILVVSPSAVQADGEYQIVIENGDVGVPEQTRTVNGEEFTARSIGFVEPGKQISARVNPPTDDPYDILLYDRDKKRVDAQFSARGETTATFDTGDLDPGAYIVTVRTDQTEAVQPIIIQAHETRVSLPSDIEQGNSITADISINEYSTVDAPDIGKVELVIVDPTTGTVMERSLAERIDRFEYTITTTVDYDTGEYQIYTGVYNNNGAEADELDLLSVSDRHKLTIGEQSDEKNTAGDSEDISEDQETSEGQDSEDSEGNEDKNGTSNNSPTNNTDTSNEDENTSTTELKETNSSKSSENETGDTTGQGNSSEGVIEPNEPTPPSDTSSEEVPLNGIQLIIIVLLSVAVGAKIRTRN